MPIKRLEVHAGGADRLEENHAAVARGGTVVAVPGTLVRGRPGAWHRAEESIWRFVGVHL